MGILSRQLKNKILERAWEAFPVEGDVIHEVRIEHADPFNNIYEVSIIYTFTVRKIDASYPFMRDWFNGLAFERFLPMSIQSDERMRRGVENLKKAMDEMTLNVMNDSILHNQHVDLNSLRSGTYVPPSGRVASARVSNYPAPLRNS